jgi:hypothetical protein
MDAARFEQILTLPSGRQMRLEREVDPGPPWQAVRSGGWWLLRRPHVHLKPPSYSYYFEGAVPMKLDEVDAKALMRILNRER